MNHKHDSSGRFASQDSKQYSAIHKWLVKNFGNPEKCENCGVAGNRSSGKWNIQWSNISGEYLRDISDFIGLCVSCHFKKDKIILNIRKMRQHYE